MSITIQETNLSFGSLSKRSKTTRIILHHAAASTCDAATIHQWHINKGWAGIGYHFLVRKNGIIQRGRPENTIGAHANGSNSDSIGICFEGNYMTETMPETQKKAGKELIAYLKSKYGISKVLKHSQVVSTSCPGTNFPFDEIANVFASASTVPSTISTTSTLSTSNSTRNYLQKGDKGTAVKEMQTMLIACGYSCGSTGADGDFGANTDKAVRAFQKANRLTVDGLYGTNSKAKLVSVYNSKKDYTSSVSTDSTYSHTTFVKEVQKAIGAKVDGIAGSETLSKTVTVSKSKNNKHAVVKPIQKYLNSIGYNCGTVDGIAGVKFDVAVKAFQKANGCTVDGEITKGFTTWKRLLGVK